MGAVRARACWRPDSHIFSREMRRSTSWTDVDVDTVLQKRTRTSKYLLRGV